MRLFAFLNVDKPWIAWLVYRGEMVSSQASNTQALSVWHAPYLIAAARSGQASAYYRREMTLESVRRGSFPEKISRLSGLYFFEDEGALRSTMSGAATSPKRSAFGPRPTTGVLVTMVRRLPPRLLCRCRVPLCLRVPWRREGVTILMMTPERPSVAFAIRFFQRIGARPSNFAVERTAGSPSLAAAAHRGR
jgi:hypothetical protein